MTTSLALLLPLLGLSGSEIEIFELPPSASGLTDFEQTDSTAFGDLFGQAVLIDFFASWCVPCARGVPALNALQEAFADRGLFVLGVASEEAPTLAAWVERHGLAYAWARDPDLALQIDLGFNPLPFALLLDPVGEIVWYGHPEDLDPELVERAVADTLSLPLWRWPESAAELRRALSEGRLGEALELAEALADGELGREVVALIRRRLGAGVRACEEALARGDLLRALEGAGRLEPLVAGPERERVRAVAERIRGSAEGPAVVARLERLRALWGEAGGLASRDQLEGLRARIRALVAEAPGGFVERQARSHEAALDNLAMILR